MSISSIFAGVSATTSPAATTAAGLNGAGSGTSVSSTAKLLSQLKRLAQSNPAEFKPVTADIATQLQAQAQTVGDQQGQALSNLAAKFQTSSQTGSLAALQPTGRHHHHGGGGGEDRPPCCRP